MGIPEYLIAYGSRAHQLPSIAGTYAGKSIIVCGDADCIWNDLERFGCKSGNGVAKEGWHFLTVNRLVEVFPGKIEHCYSNVYWVLSRFMKARRDEYMHEFGKPRYAHSITEGADFEWPWVGHGTSGLGGILTALALGYDRVVLAGIPLTNTPHNGEPYWRKTRFTTEVKDQDQHWSIAIERAFEGRVTSLSGRTNEWLGSPRLDLFKTEPAGTGQGSPAYPQDQQSLGGEQDRKISALPVAAGVSRGRQG